MRKGRRAAGNRESAQPCAISSQRIVSVLKGSRKYRCVVGFKIGPNTRRASVLTTLTRLVVTWLTGFAIASNPSRSAILRNVAGGTTASGGPRRDSVPGGMVLAGIVGISRAPYQ